MDALPQDDLHPLLTIDPALSRRGFLRTAALTGGGLLAVGIAACAPTAGAPKFTYAPPVAGLPARSGGPSGPPAEPGMSGMPMPSPAASGPAASVVPSGPIPKGWTAHDVEARTVVRRYLGNLLPPSGTSTATPRSPSSSTSSAPPTTTPS